MPREDDRTRIQELENELDALRTAVQRLVFLLEERRLLRPLELDAVRELWGERRVEPARALDPAGSAAPPRPRSPVAAVRPRRRRRLPSVPLIAARSVGSGPTSVGRSR